MVHGYMVYTERAETAAISRGTSHASAVSTPLQWIFKNMRYKKLFTHVESHASATSLLESGEQRYIKAINNNVGEWGWGVEGKQVGSMDEESQVRGCYNITFICTPANQETV